MMLSLFPLAIEVNPNGAGRDPSTAGLDTPEEHGLLDPPLRAGSGEDLLPDGAG